MADRTVTIDLIGRDRVSPALTSASRSADHAERSFTKAGKTFARVGRLAAVGLVAGVTGAAVALKTFNNDARESERVTKITASQLKTTGHAANLTAKQIRDLATAVSEKTGIDDEQIQANANLLLSFRDIRDEAGKGNKIFSRTTALAQDVATVMGTDASGASLQLGKALNNPIKGLARLGRIGVQFTDQQTKQVTAMDKAGNTLGAQKVILHELVREFGGAAAAAATPMDKLKVTLHNVSEAIGLRLIPYIDRGATALMGLIKGFQAGTGTGGRIAGIFQQIADRVRAAVPVVQSLVTWIRDNLVPTFVMIATQVGPQLRATFERIFNSLHGHEATFRTLAALFQLFAREQIPEVVAALKTIGVAFQGLMKLLDLVVAGVRLFVRSFLDSLGMIVNAAAKAFGWLPGRGGKLKRAAGSFNDFRARVEASLSGIAGKGYNMGRDFALGLAHGIEAGGKVAIATAVGVANKVAANYAAAQQSQSPSKVAIKLGEFFSHGLAVGIEKGGKKAVAAAKDLLANITGKASDLRQQARDIASAASDAVKGVLDISAVGQSVETTTAGRSIIDPLTGAVTQGADVTTSTTPSAASTLAGFASQAKAFAAALAVMAKKKLPLSLIAAVAAAGPAAGLTAAQAFASESRADDASVRASIGAIDKAAGQVGAQQRAASGLDPKIDALAKEIRELKRVLDSPKEARLTINKGGDLIVTYVNTKNKEDKRKK